MSMSVATLCWQASGHTTSSPHTSPPPTCGGHSPPDRSFSRWRLVAHKNPHPPSIHPSSDSLSACALFTQDPEGILAAPQGGHVQRRTFQKQVAESEEMAERVEAERQKAREALMAKRAARSPPSEARALVEYFLETEADELEYEVARTRPALSEDFFKELDAEVGTARFAKVVNEDRVAELEMLRDFLKQAIAAFDAQAAALAAPAERMRKLLTAKDKRATLLEMAGANEIDKELVALLDTNAKAAKSAGQEEAAEFLGKVRDAARKFLISV